MASVGERLRLLRESRDTSIDDMGVATGIGRSYLEALERDQIHVLPGKAFGKLYIRAYAEVFGFDPQPWIEDYDREQRFVAGASNEPVRHAPAGSRPVAAAIARWKEERAAAERSDRTVENVEPVEAVGKVESVEGIIEEEVSVEVLDAVVPEPDAPTDAPTDAPVVPIEASAPATAGVQAANRPIAAFVLLGVVAIASAIYLGTRGTGGDKPPGPTAEARPVVPPAPESRPPEPPPPVVAAPKPPPAARPSVVRTPSAPGALTVTEFGVGRRVVNSRLEGEGSEFKAGEVVCFQTRVVGGGRGDTVRHVWIYDGRAQQAITLRVGGPDWRTHTNKTLLKTGPWTVEARDTDGRVLATASFACVPAAR